MLSTKIHLEPGLVEAWCHECYLRQWEAVGDDLIWQPGSMEATWGHWIWSMPELTRPGAWDHRSHLGLL